MVISYLRIHRYIFLIGAIFFQACGTKTIAEFLCDPQEILLQDLVTLAPAIILSEALEGIAAFRAFFGAACIFHPQRVKVTLTFSIRPPPIGGFIFETFTVTFCTSSK